MRDVLSEGKWMIEKLLEKTCEVMTESTVAYGKDILAAAPTYEQTWKGEERTEGKWKLKFPFTSGPTLKKEISVETNAIILQHLSLKENKFAFNKVIGMLKGITSKDRFFVACEFQLGTVIDHPIPAGLMHFHEDYSFHQIRIVPNRSDSSPAYDVNPLTELVRFEAGDHHWNDSKLVHHLGKLPKEQSCVGGPPILGNNPTEYKFRFPRVLIAIPYGMKTILTVCSQIRLDDMKKPKIEFQGKDVKVVIIPPKMSDLNHYLGALQQMAHLVKHIGYSIETYNEFKSDKFDLPGFMMQNLEQTAPSV